METLEELRALLKNGASVFLISTSLIEAGVDVSFPIVIRSFAGLPSILQAAGRCNRNGEQALGRVYVWTLSEEKLERLPFVQHGQALTADVMLMAREERLDLQDLVCIRLYFDKEQNYTAPKENAMLSEAIRLKTQTSWNCWAKTNRVRMQWCGSIHNTRDDCSSSRHFGPQGRPFV